MTIKSAEFITSYAAADKMETDGSPEIAIVGKSNVGKSSLINALANNQKLARTSSEPGKTRLINLFRFNLREGGCFTLVDLPGYGFARVSHAEKASWGKMIEGYLRRSAHLTHVISLVDIRHEPTADDVAMIEYMRHYGLPFTVVATKADKISRAQIGRSTQIISRALQVQPWEIIPTSAQNKSGLDGLLSRIENALIPPDTPDHESEAAITESDGADNGL